MLKKRARILKTLSNIASTRTVSLAGRGKKKDKLDEKGEKELLEGGVRKLR